MLITAEDHTAVIAKAREGYFPVTELESEKTSLATVEGQIASLTKQLEAAKKEMTSLEERAKSMIVEAKGGQKVSDALVAGLQNQLSTLENFVTERCRSLLGAIC